MKSAPPEQKVQDVNKVRQILVVEDEQPIREMVAFALRRAGYDVAEAATSQDARVRLANQRPDLMLVDWMLPDMSGLELTRQVKRDPQTRDVPIIMLTARAAEGDKVAGLDGGADDYMTKPFSPRELLSRINAVLRRGGAVEEGDKLQVAGLTMDRASHRVSRGDREVTLGPTEYRMLEFFMQNTERVYSRSQLLDRVWGGNVYIEERTIDVHIRRLRKALEDVQMDHLIQTVRGSGYRFSAKEQAE
jgi:two-component system, OmpR family, phosphate regulon response regulator PhoB